MPNGSYYNTVPGKKWTPVLHTVREEVDGDSTHLKKTVKSAPIKLTTISRQFNESFLCNRTNLNRRKNVAFCNFSQVKCKLQICRYYSLGICYRGESGGKKVLFTNFHNLSFTKTFVGIVMTVS